jgi:hypothetical protein
MPKNLNVRKSLLTLAVAAAFTAPGAYGAQQIIGAGAATANTSLQYIILNDYCAGATNVTYWDNGTAPANTTAAPYSAPNGTIYRLTCTPNSTATKFTGGLDVSYDTGGGSWKSFTASNSSLLATSQQTTANPFPVSTVATSGGTTFGGYVTTVNGSTFTFTYVYGAAVSFLPSTTTVSFGLAEMEIAPFINSSYNQPLVNATWDGTNKLVAPDTLMFQNPAFAPGGPVTFTGSAGSATTPYPAFSAVIGVAASAKLLAALQNDQIATSILPSTCSGSTAASCVPYISKAQYASLIATPNQVVTGSLGYAPLFTSTAAQASYAPIEIARFAQGGGSQVLSNAYFLGQACVSGTEATNPPYLPYDVGINPGNTGGNTELPLFYSYNYALNNVIARIVSPVSPTSPPAGSIISTTNPLPSAIPGQSGTIAAQPGPSSGYVIGVTSAYKASSLTGGAGFLRLDGFAPTTANAQLGLYNFMTTLNFIGNPSANGDALTLIVDLLGVNGVPVKETLAGFSGAGFVQFSASKYTNNNSLCTGWQHD